MTSGSSDTPNPPEPPRCDCGLPATTAGYCGDCYMPPMLREQWGWQLGDFPPNVCDSQHAAQSRVDELNAMFKADPESKKHSALSRRVVRRYVSEWTAP